MPPTIAESIEAWRTHQLNGTQLMRAIVSHQHWQVPVSEAAAMEMLATNSLPRIQFSKDPQGVSRLLLWSSAESLANWAKSATSEQHTLDTTGSWIFALPLDGQIDEIWIDPLTPHDIFYKKAQFPALRDLAAAVAIEKDIADLRAGTASDGAVVRLREYPSYRLPVAQSAAGNRIIFAPDTQNRTLAAVFTAQDSFDAFLPEAQAAAGADTLVAMRGNGSQLFHILAGMDHLTGIVFNCSGPIKPIAFAAGLSKVVLEA